MQGCHKPSVYKNAQYLQSTIKQSAVRWDIYKLFVPRTPNWILEMRNTLCSQNVPPQNTLQSGYLFTNSFHSVIILSQRTCTISSSMVVIKILSQVKKRVWSNAYADKIFFSLLQDL